MNKFKASNKIGQSL